MVANRFDPFDTAGTLQRQIASDRAARSALDQLTRASTIKNLLERKAAADAFALEGERSAAGLSQAALPMGIVSPHGASRTGLAATLGPDVAKHLAQWRSTGIMDRALGAIEKGPKGGMYVQPKMKDGKQIPMSAEDMIKAAFIRGPTSATMTAAGLGKDVSKEVHESVRKMGGDATKVSRQVQQTRPAGSAVHDLSRQTMGLQPYRQAATQTPTSALTAAQRSEKIPPGIRKAYPNGSARQLKNDSWIWEVTEKGQRFGVIADGSPTGKKVPIR